MRGLIGKILGYFGASHELHIKRNVVTYRGMRYHRDCAMVFKRIE